MTKEEYAKYLRKLLETMRNLVEDMEYCSFEDTLAVAQFQFTIARELYQIEKTP